MREIDKGQDYEERRQSVREPGPFAAVVRLYSGRSLPCVIVNVSDRGAKLAFPKETVLPKEFELSIPAKNASWRVRVAWQQARELGVYRI